MARSTSSLLMASAPDLGLATASTPPLTTLSPLGLGLGSRPKGNRIFIGWVHYGRLLVTQDNILLALDPRGRVGSRDWLSVESLLGGWKFGDAVLGSPLPLPLPILRLRARGL